MPKKEPTLKEPTFKNKSKKLVNKAVKKPSFLSFLEKTALRMAVLRKLARFYKILKSRIFTDKIKKSRP